LGVKASETARIIERSRVLGSRYERAIREEDLEELLMVRYEMAAAVQQADRILADAIVDNIERRLANDDG
jgi:hypothetical protein